MATINNLYTYEDPVTSLKLYEYAMFSAQAYYHPEDQNYKDNKEYERHYAAIIL